jgi:hypothetical protein
MFIQVKSQVRLSRWIILPAAEEHQPPLKEVVGREGQQRLALREKARE